jgi:hypothetical protein
MTIFTTSIILLFYNTYFTLYSPSPDRIIQYYLATTCMRKLRRTPSRDGVSRLPSVQWRRLRPRSWPPLAIPSSSLSIEYIDRVIRPPPLRVSLSGSADEFVRIRRCVRRPVGCSRTSRARGAAERCAEGVMGGGANNTAQ